MRWFSQSLNRKFVIGTASGLLISLVVFIALFSHLYSGQLEQERSVAATQVNRLLQTSLENAMLKRDLEGLRTIVERLGNQSHINTVFITNPAGEVRFASTPTLLGRQLTPMSGLPESGSAEFATDENGFDVLRSINPVQNKEPCQECHGEIEQNPVNGILYVDYDAAPIRKQAWATTLLLMSSGSLIVLLNLGGGWWFIRRFILRPVDRLTAASQQLSSGGLDARVSLEGNDELARLGETFNRMATNLQSQMQKLKEKEQFLQQLVNAIPDGVRIIDQEHRILLANHTYWEQIGKKEEEKSGLCYSAHNREAPCPASLITCPLHELAESDKPLRVVHSHQRGNGQRLDVEIYAAPMRVLEHGEPKLLVVESIRDLEQEVKFSHEQKLSELGRLASGVAHEIHNPLASVRLALHASQRENASEEVDRQQVAEYLELVDHEIDKCIEVTERMLKLSTPPPSQPELVVADQIVEEILKLLKWEAENRSVQLHFSVTDHPLRVMASDSEMRMVTLNLAQNALHAMPRGGELRVNCRRADKMIEIEFQDTGVGINSADLLRLFEPFFSRRADNVRGTGLGLSITKAILDKHGGIIEVASQVGNGSLFTVRLPDVDLEKEA